jgi:hypothetical protein
LRKQKKSLTLTQLKKKLDDAFAAFIRRRDDKCMRCNRWDNLQCAHIFSRSHMATRWDPDNALCLCLKCHLFWAHRAPIEFSEWIRDVYLGEFNYQQLRAKANSIKIWQRWEMEELLQTLKGGEGRLAFY